MRGSPKALPSGTNAGMRQSMQLQRVVHSSDVTMPDPLPKREPFYTELDVIAVLERAPIGFKWKLSNGNIHQTVTRMNTTAQAYRSVLMDYQHVRYMPLEPFYQLRKATSTLDEELLCDLLFSYSSGYMGAWFAALAPQPAYVRHLERSLALYQQPGTVTRLALAACGHDVPADLEDTYAQLTGIRNMLKLLPALPAPLRQHWTREQIAAIKQELRALRRAYRAGGYDGARTLLSQGIWGYFRMTHQEWLAAGAPAAPALPPMPRLRHKVLPRF